MKDTIYREDALDALYSLDEYNPRSVKAIRGLPSAEPKTGNWIVCEDDRFVKCSECGMKTTRNELRGISLFGKNEPNFCPNCGSKMEGK